jgi:two-component system phosphate regulon sensor histidine kinase PhoR
MISRLKWFFHPVFIFVFSILALALSLFLYIYWYIEVSTGLKAAVRRYNLDPQQFLEAQTWVVILVLSILVGIILVGIFIIFVYSQKMARLNRMQHEFINNFTHELKTPVTSLKLYLETFLKHELPRKEQAKYIGYMLQDIERLSDNISRILNLARIETKTYGGEFIISDLVENVQRFHESNRHLFGNCDIQIHNPSGQPFRYSINPPLFEMLLMNIINNGVKYNDNENPRIDIRFVQKNDGLHIRFEDNGIGIEKADAKKIFRKFYQTKRVDGLSARGSGLGLYLVQNIARMHRGKVIAEKRQNEKGSVITLILPFRHQQT